MKEYARQYNEMAEEVNDAVKEGSKNAFSLLTALMNVLSAVWIALKNLI